jgi:Leucine-rich repeat (LRR) protein
VNGWPVLKVLRCAASDLGSLDVFKETSLSELSLYEGTFSDLTPLIGNPLTYLRIERAPVTDLTPLAQCTKLRNLYLPGTKISDLGPLSNLSLGNLDVSSTQVKSLLPVKGDPLTDLRISNTAISDLSPIKDANFSTLEASNTLITDISLLDDMPIRRFKVGGTKIKDFSVIAEFAGLNTLWVNDTTFNNLGMLRGKPLVELRLDGCAGIDNIEALNGQNSLRNLTIPRRHVDGAWVLRRLKRLQRINHKFDNWRMTVNRYFGR